jgi:hypothetical protein
MTAPRVVAISLIFATLISPGDGASAARAVGCSYEPPDNPNERLNLAVERSELVLVGIVIDERLAPPREGHNVSTVKPEAVLKGQAPAGNLEFPYLAESWLCIGGPRLFVGNRYLLSIRLEPDPDGSGPAGRFWQTQLVGGQVLLENGNAHMDDYKAKSDTFHEERSIAVHRQGRRSGSVRRGEKRQPPAGDGERQCSRGALGREHRVEHNALGPTLYLHRGPRRLHCRLCAPSDPSSKTTFLKVKRLILSHAKSHQ